MADKKLWLILILLFAISSFLLYYLANMGQYGYEEYVVILNNDIYQRPMTVSDAKYAHEANLLNGTQNLSVYIESSYPFPKNCSKLAIRGVLEEIDLGGAPGTKESYAGFHLYPRGEIKCIG